MRSQNINEQGHFPSNVLKLNGDKHHLLEMKVELTEVGKIWISEPHLQGIIWEYDPDKPFRLQGWRAAGYHEMTFDASNLASGLYFYRIEAGDFAAVKKMVLMK